VPGFEGEKDVAAGFAVARTGDPIVLGGQDRLRQPPDVRRWVLWVVLALGVSMLGWMAWRLSREMAASAKTDESKSLEPPRG
jgi:hypothetical protein